MAFISLATSLLRTYKRFISPVLLSSCRFTPTCSCYAMEAVERHGMFVGSLLSIWRILRCNPFSKGGLDTVPLQILKDKEIHFCNAGERVASADLREQSARAQQRSIAEPSY